MGGVELVAPLIGFSWTFVLVLFNVVVLYLVMKHFFFEKVHNFMEARKHAVEDSFAHAQRTNELADGRLTEYQQKISGIEEEKRIVLREAKLTAEKQADQIVAEANQRAEQMMKNARTEIERERAAAMEQMKEQVAALALFAAGKILEQELSNDESRRRILEQAVKEVGRSEWRN